MSQTLGVCDQRTSVDIVTFNPMNSYIGIWENTTGRDLFVHCLVKLTSMNTGADATIKFASLDTVAESRGGLHSPVDKLSSASGDVTWLTDKFFIAAGETCKFFAKSTNASDTAVTANVSVMEGAYADVHRQGGVDISGNLSVDDFQQVDIVSAGGTELYDMELLTMLAKVILNNAKQNKSTGVIVHYDDDGLAPIKTFTPSETEAEIIRTSS